MRYSVRFDNFDVGGGDICFFTRGKGLQDRFQLWRLNLEEEATNINSFYNWIHTPS